MRKRNCGNNRTNNGRTRRSRQRLTACLSLNVRQRSPNCKAACRPPPAISLAGASAMIGKYVKWLPKRRVFAILGFICPPFTPGFNCFKGKHQQKFRLPKTCAAQFSTPCRSASRLLNKKTGGFAAESLFYVLTDIILRIPMLTVLVNPYSYKNSIFPPYGNNNNSTPPQPTLDK